MFFIIKKNPFWMNSPKHSSENIQPIERKNTSTIPNKIEKKHTNWVITKPVKILILIVIQGKK